MHDAFVLTCTIHTMPPTPEPSLAPSPTMTTITLPESNPQGYSSLPSALVDILRAMVDDPTISDVQFVFPRSKGNGHRDSQHGQYATNGHSSNAKTNGLTHSDRMHPADDDIQSEEGGTGNSEFSSMPNVRIISARKDILALRSDYFAKCGWQHYLLTVNAIY
jgi:hypothetical protein